MVAQLAKSLKPKKLKVDKVRLNILNELRKEGRAVKKEFEKTTATWKGQKPKFTFAIGLDSESARVIVGPAGSQKGAQKWVWLDEGTKPHTIAARRVPNLIFRHGSGFRPKTKVKVFGSGPGQNNGPWVRKKSVRHPGIEARDWTKEIVKRRKARFTRAILKAAKV